MKRLWTGRYNWLVWLCAGVLLATVTHIPRWQAYVTAEAAAELAAQEADWREGALEREDARVAARLEKEMWEEYGPVTFERTVEAETVMVAGAKRQVSVDSAWGGVLGC